MNTPDTNIEALLKKAMKQANDALDLCLGELIGKEGRDMFLPLCMTNASLFAKQPQLTAAVMAAAMLRLAQQEAQA